MVHPAPHTKTGGCRAHSRDTLGPSTPGPGRPDSLVIHRQLPMRARHLQGGRVGRRVNGLRLLAAPHALRGALLHPGHGAAGEIQDVGSLPPVPQASALANLLSRGAEPGLMLVLHLGDVEGLQAPLLELGARSRWTSLAAVGGA